jgi:CubicO group peptidase (beta-lactamase class C family)
VKRALIAVIVLVAAVGAFYGANETYWNRFIDVVSKGGNGDEGTYAPIEEINGAHAGFFEPVAESDRTIPAAALEAARDYAGKNRSSSLLIWHKGKLQAKTYWGGDEAAAVNSRSLHKMLGGLLIGAAIKDGYIKSLDDSVADYIPAWRGTPKAAMTVRNVLHMSSGLMWFRPGGPYSLASRRYLDPHWDDILLNRIPLDFAPGSAFDYSDITADIMPHIIQGATKRRYTDYLSEAILQPIGAQGGRIWMNREGGLPHGGCCLILPPETWLRIGLLVLNGGKASDKQILPDWWTAVMRKPSPNNQHFGLMVWLGQPYTQRRLYARPNGPNNRAPRPGAYHSEPYLADDLFLFDGLNGQIVYIIPSQELIIVRTGLRPPPGQPEWDNAKLPNMILRTLGVGAPQIEKKQVAAVKAYEPSLGEQLESESRFWSRWMAIKDQTAASTPSWIDVRETVKGGDGPEIPAATERTIAPEAIQAASDYAGKMSSLSLIIARGGKVEHEQYWNGAGSDTVSETYSMAKSVVGLSIGAAIADGKISSVDDAAANYIAEWRGQRRETITIRQLLTMSSGVRHYRFNYAFQQSPWAEGLRTFLGPDITRHVMNAEIDRVPGAEFNYNSANTQILLTVLERATGRRYADYVSEKLWKPLGAKDATLWLDRPNGTARGFSYFQARPRDWLRIGLLIEGQGKFGGREILPENWIAAMTTPSQRNPNYGFQMWLGNPPLNADGKPKPRQYNRNTPFGAKHSAPYLADDVLFFDGGGGHRVYIVPSRDLVIVRTGMVNRPDWDDAALPNAVLAGITPATD